MVGWLDFTNLKFTQSKLALTGEDSSKALLFYSSLEVGKQNGKESELLREHRAIVSDQAPISVLPKYFVFRSSGYLGSH